jgi:hypothetical protein
MTGSIIMNVEFLDNESYRDSVNERVVGIVMNGTFVNVHDALAFVGNKQSITYVFKAEVIVTLYESVVTFGVVKLNGTYCPPYSFQCRNPLELPLVTSLVYIESKAIWSLM